MYYYSNTLTKATLETKLVIDTRGATKAPAKQEDMDDEESVDPMGMAIQTKYLLDKMFCLYIFVLGGREPLLLGKM